ncbi:MAG: hypothetical protein GQ542_19910 [Desulforhopalus sp.]|nr:hypothetical protein [Desulforhopalus sp.]
MKEIACFVSPHGFGHATRTIAVVEALQRSHSDIHAHFFTTIPEFLFEQTLTNFSYHPVLVDVGLVQRTALDSDIPATIKQLDRLLPFSTSFIEKLALVCSKCSLIVCDIAPVGIAVGQYTGIPSILVENFTWDWIYQPYLEKYPKLTPHFLFLKKLFARADYRIQTEPLCFPTLRDLHCGPIFRRMKEHPTSLRKQLKCGDKKLVIVTMGGVFQQPPCYSRMEEVDDILFLFSGQEETTRVGKNIILLGRNNGLYHPDLLNAADLVVCKAGYSTVAECFQAGTRVISVGRDDFPESAILQSYLEEKLGAVSITPKMYQNGSWISIACDLLAKPSPTPVSKNGADQVASFLNKLM